MLIRYDMVGTIELKTDTEFKQMTEDEKDRQTLAKDIYTYIQIHGVM